MLFLLAQPPRPICPTLAPEVCFLVSVFYLGHRRLLTGGVSVPLLIFHLLPVSLVSCHFFHLQWFLLTTLVSYFFFILWLCSINSVSRDIALRAGEEVAQGLDLKQVVLVLSIAEPLHI